MLGNVVGARDTQLGSISRPRFTYDLLAPYTLPSCMAPRSGATKSTSLAPLASNPGLQCPGHPALRGLGRIFPLFPSRLPPASTMARNDQGARPERFVPHLEVGRSRSGSRKSTKDLGGWSTWHYHPAGSKPTRYLFQFHPPSSLCPPSSRSTFLQ